MKLAQSICDIARRTGLPRTFQRADQSPNRAGFRPAAADGRAARRCKLKIPDVLALGDANAELRHRDAQARTNVAGFLAHAVVLLGHARKRIDSGQHADKGVVRTTTTGAAVADSMCRLHRDSPNIQITNGPAVPVGPQRYGSPPAGSNASRPSPGGSRPPKSPLRVPSHPPPASPHPAGVECRMPSAECLPPRHPAFPALASRRGTPCRHSWPRQPPQSPACRLPSSVGRAADS